MQFPSVTAFYAGLLALVFVVLSGWVIVGRGQFGVSLGHAANDRLRVRVRAHANFAEYVPLALFLVALLEASHTSRSVVHALLLPLLVARLAHPFGLIGPDRSAQQMICRGGSIVVTLVVLAVAAVLLLLRGF